MDDLILKRKPEITISTGQIMVFAVDCTDNPMLSADCGASPPLSPTCTSTFFSFDFLAGVTAVTAVTTIRATVPPNTNWTSRNMTKEVEENELSVGVVKPQRWWHKQEG